MVSADEMRKGKVAETQFKQLDADGDGKITREWIAKYGNDKGFNQYDLDGELLLQTCASCVFLCPVSIQILNQLAIDVL